MTLVHFLRSLSLATVLLFSVGVVSRVSASSHELVGQLFLPTTTSATVNSREPETITPLKTLEDYLIENKDAPAPLGFLRSVILNAIGKGLSAEMLALLLLLPAVATLVAFSRHVIGLTGFSIYAPAGLAIVFLSTGVLPGLVLFLLMLVVATLGKWVISFMKLEYVPRTAMLLWSVSIGLFLSLILSTYFPALAPLRVEIFPLLLLVLLAEDFMAPIAGLRWRLIVDRSLQIMFLAVIGGLFIGSRVVQQFALLNPEIVIVLVVISNFLIGRYLGLRLTEYFRFRPLMDAEE